MSAVTDAGADDAAGVPVDAGDTDDGGDTGSAATTRAAAGMGAITAVSRAVGFVRVLVIAAVLGTTYLGNAFQAANSLSFARYSRSASPRRTGAKNTSSPGRSCPTRSRSALITWATLG